MIQANGKNGFTLVELLVVVGMLAVLLAALTTSVTAARHRTRVQKATSDVKVIAQAILAYENYNKSGDDYRLPTMDKAEASKKNLGFLLGTGTTEGGDRLPVLLEAALSSAGVIKDPWGHPYYVTIKSQTMSLKISTASSNIKAGYSLPNVYRISEDER